MKNVTVSIVSVQNDAYIFLACYHALQSSLEQAE